jgi:putative transcriptional regulator
MKNSVKAERAKLAITQNELAEAIRVSRQTIYSIEKERFIPSVITAFKIAAYFNMKAEDIFHLEPTD